MPLSFTSRHVGETIVVTCAGRIVAGEETAAFEQHLDRVIELYRQVLVHLGDVDFIDSAGLGLLVRYMTRAQNASGALRICAVSAPIDRVLKVSRLKPVLQPYDTEADALADAHRGPEQVTGTQSPVLCVDQSEDVLAYLRELLRGAGYRPITAANLPDAVILVSATRPRVIVIGAAFRTMTGTRSADEFRRLTAAATVIELPSGFASEEAGNAAEQVLNAVNAACRPQSA